MTSSQSRWGRFCFDEGIYPWKLEKMIQECPPDEPWNLINKAINYAHVHDLLLPRWMYVQLTIQQWVRECEEQKIDGVHLYDWELDINIKSRCNYDEKGFHLGLFPLLTAGLINRVYERMSNHDILARVMREKTTKDRNTVQNLYNVKNNRRFNEMLHEELDLEAEARDVLNEDFELPNYHGVTILDCKEHPKYKNRFIPVIDHEEDYHSDSGEFPPTPRAMITDDEDDEATYQPQGHPKKPPTPTLAANRPEVKIIGPIRIRGSMGESFASNAWPDLTATIGYRGDADSTHASDVDLNNSFSVGSDVEEEDDDNRNAIVIMGGFHDEDDMIPASIPIEPMSIEGQEEAFDY